MFGTAPLVSHEDGSTGTRLDRGDFERLPLNGRGLLTLLEMAPGTNVIPATRGDAGQFSTAGQRAECQLLHRRRHQRQHGRDGGRTAGADHRRVAAGAQRLRQHGLADLARFDPGAARHHIELGRGVRTAAGRERRAHQPLGVERLSRRGHLPDPQRDRQRQRLVRQRRPGTTACRSGCTISTEPSADRCGGTRPSSSSPTSVSPWCSRSCGSSRSRLRRPAPAAADWAQPLLKLFPCRPARPSPRASARP